MDIPIHAVRSFCVLSDQLHFGRAAERLNITTPSLSQQISRLEAQVGVKLFERTPRRVELTVHGAQMLVVARQLVADHDRLLQWANGVQQDQATPVLRVGVVAAGAGPLTTEAIAVAGRKAPDARFEMRRLGFFEVVEELETGRVDAVFAPAPLRLPPRIKAMPLWKEPRVLVVAAGHPLANRESITIDETSNEVFVLAGGGDPEQLSWWLVDPRPDGTRPKRGPTADSIEGLLELVAAGAGVNIAAESASRHYRREELAFVPISDIEPATIVLCTRADSTHPLLRLFVETARELSPLHPAVAT